MFHILLLYLLFLLASLLHMGEQLIYSNSRFSLWSVLFYYWSQLTLIISLSSCVSHYQKLSDNLSMPHINVSSSSDLPIILGSRSLHFFDPMHHASHSLFFMRQVFVINTLLHSFAYDRYSGFVYFRQTRYRHIILSSFSVFVLGIKTCYSYL